ncbi:MAG: hypothetical protein ACRD96_04925, partial [Bryobacteraceae bacterium]
MWRCDSERRLRRWVLAAALALGFAALAFSVFQNRAAGPGGVISTAKLLWLVYALLFWFVLPPLIAADARIDPVLRRVYALFFASFAARGLAELWMMYVAINWHPYYGIAHDAATGILVLYLLRGYSARGPLDRLFVAHFGVVGAMLCAEMGFAAYFAANFVTAGLGALYFVPADGRHDGVLLATSIVNAGLT